MALTGLQIQKLLPKTNCKECGSNTCMAFAMKLASKKADLSLCPYASEEAKQVLGAASEPPVKCIALGADKNLKLGEETVLYRHEKTFVHQTALAINVDDTDPPDVIDGKLTAVRDYVMERVGETHRIELVSITQKSSDDKTFLALVKKALEVTQRPLVLRSQDTQTLVKAAEEAASTSSVLASANADNFDKLQQAASANGHALAVTAQDLDSLCRLTSELRDKNFKDILLQLHTDSLAEQFQVNSIARRAALKQDYRPLGFPHLRFVESGDMFQNTVTAVNEILKYGGICVLPDFDPAQLVSLMTLRLNIFTDPQKPIQVEPNIYPIGEPTADSPVFLTTNFSLTYFIVSGEIENSGISAWLIVPECEGMSVLTAWSAGKFSGDIVAKFIKEIELEQKVKNRQIIIPGYVSQISGDLEEGLPGWQVLVGPQEAADIESFVNAKLR